MKKFLGRLANFVVGCIWTVVAQAAPIAIDVSDLGWYAQDGTHDSYNINTLTGNYFLGTEYRSFYVFNLPSLEGKRIVSAAFEVDIRYSLGVSSSSYPSPDQTGSFYSIEDQNLTRLTQDNGGGYGQEVFADLGSGQQFGATFLQQDQIELVRFDLNEAAVLHLNGLTNGIFAMGLRNTTTDMNEYMWLYFLFSSMSEPGLQRLLLEVEDAQAVPEPATLPLLAISLLALGAAGRRGSDPDSQRHDPPRACADREPFNVKIKKSHTRSALRRNLGSPIAAVIGRLKTP